MATIVFQPGVFFYLGTELHDEFYLTGATAGVTVSALGSSDYIRSGPFGDFLVGGLGDDFIYGGDGSDVVFGSGGNDTLSGDIDNGSGVVVPDNVADTVRGEDGNDTLLLSAFDVGFGGPGDDFYDLKNFTAASIPTVTENVGEGIDTVGVTGSALAIVTNYALGANLENLNLGDFAFNGFGNGLDNTIIGNSLSNQLFGLDGNDILSGGASDDFLRGGLGNDILYGGTENDILIGEDGNDTLIGDTGADNMQGGLGDDLYSVDNPLDVISESVNGGYDEVYSTVSMALPDNFETLFLIGTGAINGTGNAANNAIIGNDASNILDAGAGTFEFMNGLGGDDLLIGGPGHDEMMGGAGADKFRYYSSSEGPDFIYDFTPGQDKFDFNAIGFGGLTGLINGVNFFSGNAPTPAQATPTILYNNQFAYLFYDADGTGPQAPVVLALLNGVPAVQASDFTFF